MGKSRPAAPDCGDHPETPGGSGPAPAAGGAGTPGTGTGTAPASPSVRTPCTPPVTRDVSTRVDETISNGPPEWNLTTWWNSKYQLTVDRDNCTVSVTVRIKVTGTITNDQKAAWKSAIETKWNNKVYFCCSGCNCPRGLTPTITVQYVDSGEDYAVAAQTPGAAEGGRAGLGGTTSMTGWGVNDTIDITHEFGHMLGNAEEYFTTNGVDYSEGGAKQGSRDPSGGVMNNPANDPLPRNYDSIRGQVEQSLGRESCATRAVAH